MAFGFECDDGWYDLISRLCDELNTVINNKYPYLKDIPKDNNGYPNFFVTQVKEKFGMLCFYTTGAPDEIFDIIEKYEKESMTTCEICGKSGKSRIKNNWIKTLCTEHKEELEYEDFK